MNTLRNFLPALAALAALSCADEPVDPTGNEGIETTIALSLTAVPETPGLAGTRALPDSPVVDEGTDPDYIVKDFWLIQFDENGLRIGAPRYYLMPTLTSTTAVAVIKPTSGTYKCVLLANTHSEAFGLVLGPIKTLAELKTVYKKIGGLGDMYNAGGLVPDLFMNGTVDIDNGTTALTCALYRNVAKLTLTINNTAASGVTITSVQLRDVSARIFYVDQLFNDDATPSPSSTQSGVLDLPVDAFELAPGDPVKTLCYYLPRNRRGTTGTSTEAQKNLHAPGRATYIEIMAANSVGKPLRYRFYPGANMTNDFNIVPNYHYTLPVVFNSAGGDGDSRVENLGEVQLAASNSYIIHPLSGAAQATYGVPVTRVNEFWDSPDGLPANVLGPDTEWEAEVIWQDKAGAGLIDFCDSNGTPVAGDKYEGAGGGSNFYFSPAGPTARGNVLIGIKKKGAPASDGYLWSWHMWITDYNPDAAPSSWQEDVYSHDVTGGAVHRYADGTGTTWSTRYTDKFIMDRNLGAASADRAQGVDNTAGLYYQYGRKDPFPASNVVLYDGNGVALPRYHNDADCISRITGRVSIKTAVSYPYYFYRGNAEWMAGTNPYVANLWNNPAAGTGKSLFDPCPPGWRLPVNGTWNTFTLAGHVPNANAANNSAVNPGATIDYKGYTDQAGWDFYLSGSSGATAFYPATGFRDSANTGANVNKQITAYCWLATPYGVAGYGLCLYCTPNTVGSSSTSYRGHGLPTRCIQE